MSNNNVRKLKINTVWSLIYTLLLLVSGFILPKLIIVYFNSSINGLVNSVTQFLQVFTFLELGVAAVTKSTLYGSIAKNDIKERNQIITSASNFYRKIGYVLIGYILLLVLIYPLYINNEYGFISTAILIVAHGLCMFSQYYFGVVDVCILDAYQESYVFYSIQAITLVINIILSSLMIVTGFSIYSVKIMTAIVYVLRPVIIRIYINKKYSINRKEKYDVDPITQKWNGVAQHISFIILQSTDTILLTFFCSLSMVSVYSVYNMVISGINSLITAVIINSSTLLGNLYKKEEYEEFNNMFFKLSSVTHCLITVVFGAACVLIVPFVNVYTNGVVDAEYYQPLFAMIIVLANFMYCLRLPYTSLIQATGHFKETQRIFVISALLNFFSSLLLINMFGLVGVAIGTIIAMFFQTISLAKYCEKKILVNQSGTFFKFIILDLSNIAVLYLAFFRKLGLEYTIGSWLTLAIVVTAVSCFVYLLIQGIFNYKNLKMMFR